MTSSRTRSKPIRIFATYPGLTLIITERLRQVAQEGWTPEHDDLEHQAGDLASAALCYTAHASHQVAFPNAAPLTAEMYTGRPGRLWPWDSAWWKPSPDPIRNLEKAGALIAAEIDRLLRLREREQAAEQEHQDTAQPAPAQPAPKETC